LACRLQVAERTVLILWRSSNPYLTSHRVKKLQYPETTNDTVKSEVFKQIALLLEDKSLTVTDDMPLIGGESILDSMRLVELCLALEDKAAEVGFDFDWTSDAAMSRSRSMFRTAESLATEFIRQMKANK